MFNDYTRRDVESIRKALIELVVETTDKWTDFNESDLGMIFIELAAGVADLQNFYLDNQVQENFLDTAKQRANVKKLTNLLGYKFKMVNSAKCLGTFTVPYELNSDLLIPKYTQLVAEFPKSNVYYATTEDIVIPKGVMTVETTFIQGVVTTLNTTTGELRKSRTLNLMSKNVAEGSVIVKIDGEDWTEVEDARLVLEQSKVFSIHDDKDDNCYLLFNDHYDSLLPNDNSESVSVTYLDSLGVSGTVRAASIKKVVSPIILLGEDIANKLIVVNSENSSGGSDRESVDEAKVNSRMRLRSSDTLVTLQDYKDLLKSYKGISNAQVLDWSILNSPVKVPYELIIYIMPKDNYLTSEAYLNELRSYLDTKKVTSIRLEVKTAKLYDIDVKCVLYTKKGSSYHEELKRLTNDKLVEYFKVENRNFMELIRPNKLLNVIESSSDNIEFGEIELPSSTINLDFGEFPRLGSVEVTVKQLGEGGSIIG